MRQKCVKHASKMRQKRTEHLWGRTPFGRYRMQRQCCLWIASSVGMSASFGSSLLSLELCSQKQGLLTALIVDNLLQKPLVAHLGKGGTSAEGNWPEILLSYEASYEKCSKISPENSEPLFREKLKGNN